MKYLITYDLCNPGQHYEELITAIKNCGLCAYISRSTWAVESQLTAEEIKNYLRVHMDSTDILFVCNFDSWAGFGLVSNTLKFLNN